MNHVKFFLKNYSLLLLCLILLIISCAKEYPLSTPKNTTDRSDVNSRDGIIVSEETKLLTGEDGTKYSFLIRIYSDKTATIQRSRTTFPVTQDAPPISMGIQNEKTASNILTFTEGGWFIPASDETQFITIPGGGNGDFRCECEGSSENFDYFGNPCHPICDVQNEAWTRNPCDGSCCTNCDAVLCIDGRIISNTTNGLYLSSRDINSISFEVGDVGVDERSSESVITRYFYGGSCQISIKEIAGTVYVHRKQIQSQSGKKWYNLTSINATTNGITFPSSDQTWLVPFDASFFMTKVGGGTLCCEKSDTETCDRACITETNSQNCLVCHCEEGGDGGCDYKWCFGTSALPPTGGDLGGVFIQGASVSFSYE